MITIGLLGGVASGKSLVARMLAELGAGVLDADRAGHEVLAEPDVQAALQDRWGSAVFDAHGAPDRAAIAARVFSSGIHVADDREFLEQLLHPRIGRRLEQQAEDLKESGVQVVVLDAPLLLEAGWDRQCDLLVFVDAPRKLRLERALGRGWSESQFEEREAAQLDVNSKRGRADAVVPNTHGVDQLRHHVERWWNEHVVPRLT